MGDAFVSGTPHHDGGWAEFPSSPISRRRSDSSLNRCGSFWAHCLFFINGLLGALLELRKTTTIQRVYVVASYHAPLARDAYSGVCLPTMPTIQLETFINASPERCFDLSLSVDLHHQSVAQTHERPIAGVTSGMMQLGDTVTWEAVHFGIKQHLTTKITAYERPTHFTDEMLRGAFQEIIHIHQFVPQSPGTLMIDRFTFRAPLGILGRLAEMFVLTRYMKGLLLMRNNYLKQVAESDGDPALLYQSA